MKRISSIVVAAFVVLAAAGLSTGCRAKECRQMSRCCAELEDHPGVGNACGQMAQGLRDPDSCRSVLQAARAMYEKRGEKVPEACK